MAAEEIADRYARIYLDDNNSREEDGFVCDDETILNEEIACRYLLLAKIITDRPMKMTAFKDVMSGAWRPVKRMVITEIKLYLYSLQLFHVLDYERILF